MSFSLNHFTSSLPMSQLNMMHSSTHQIPFQAGQARPNEQSDESPSSESLATNLALSSGEERERKLFMSDLNKFMTEIGKPLSKIPIMGYKELDLFQLFREVTAYGGFNEVVKNVGTWSKIWKRLGNFDPSITDSSFRLKKNYERYLLEYEYKSFPEHRQQAIEYERQQQLKKSSQHHHQQQLFLQQQQQTQASAPSSSTSEPSSPTIAMAHLSLSGGNPFLPSTAGSTSPSRSSLKNSHEKIGKSSSSSKKVGPKPSMSFHASSSSSNLPTTASSASSSRPTLTRSYSAGSLNYRDIPRDRSGNVKLPLVLGELTIEALGEVIPRSPYVTDRHIWPVGFTSTRSFSSMLQPETRVRYTNQIVEVEQPESGAKLLQFIVTAEDDVDHPIVSHSPSAAWKAVLKRVMAVNSQAPSAKNNVSVSGAMRFGLAHPIVSCLLRELAGLLGGANNNNNNNNNNSNSELEMSGSNNTAGCGDQVDFSAWRSPSSSTRPKRKAAQRATGLYFSNSSEDSSSAEDSFDINSDPSSPYNSNVDYMDDAGLTSPKIQKNARNEDHFSARTVSFSTREEMDDLESAVATLQALKYCAVY